MLENENDIKVNNVNENINVNKLKENNKEKVQIKNKNVLWAKITIIILVATISILGLFKFIDYLNKPKTLFYNAVENMYSSFNTIMEKVKNIEIYNLLSSNGVEINSDIKINATGLYGEYQDLDDIINQLTFNTKTEIDKKHSYINFNLIMSKDDTVKSNINIIDDEFTYLKISDFYDSFIKLDFKELNLDVIDPNNNMILIEILKHNLLDFLKDERFSFEETTIAINETPVNCNKSTYSLKGSEILKLLSEMITSIKNNTYTLDYISKIFGIKANQVENKLNSLVNDLKINSDTIYNISAYTKTSTDEGVRLEIAFDKIIDEEENQVLIAMNRDINFLGLEYTFNNIVESLELKGSLDSSYNIIIKNKSNTINITGTNKSNENSGIIKSVENSSKKTNLEGSFSYTLKSNSNNNYSLSYNVEYSTTESNETANIKLNASSKIKTDVKIEKLAVKNAKEQKDYEKEKDSNLKTDIIDYIKNLNLTNQNNDDNSQNE